MRKHWERVAASESFGHQGRQRVVQCPCGEKQWLMDWEEEIFECSCGRQFRQRTLVELLVTDILPLKANKATTVARIKRHRQLETMPRQILFELLDER
jgi:hypothetical protein